MPSLILRYAFALPSLQIRSKSVPNPFQTMGLTWDLQGRKKGITRDKQKRMQDKDETEMKLREKTTICKCDYTFFLFSKYFLHYSWF